MSASDYKEYKGLKKENLSDNKTDIEVVLNDLVEITPRELAKKYKPYGLGDNKKIDREGGEVVKQARNSLEDKLGECIICKDNKLN